MLRFAPSPTGDMHIGNLRAAIFNYILAKQRNEPFLIRIEDTDKARNIKGADKEILSLLNLFGLFWDKLVYQSDNFSIHNDFAKKLIEKGEAFYCYATKDFLESQKNKALQEKKAFRYDDSWALICKDKNPNPVIRLKGSAKNISFFDEIKGECKFSQNEIDSFVIIREDKIPTYNFACSVDDMLYDISFIIRGEDHTSNTPKQILVREKLQYTKRIKYAHLPIILSKKRRKMSKRENESSVKWLLEQGFLPRAILNYLILMGNNPPCEIFTLEDAIKWFDLSKLSKSPVIFDIDFLRYINREHLKRLDALEMALLLKSSNINLEQIKGNEFALGELGKIFLEEASTLNELNEKISLIFMPKNINNIEFNQNALILKNEILALLAKNAESCDDFNAFKNALLKSHKDKMQGKAFFMPLRFLLTGSLKGPHLDILYPHLKPFLPYILSAAKTNDKKD